MELLLQPLCITAPPFRLGLTLPEKTAMPLVTRGVRVILGTILNRGCSALVALLDVVISTLLHVHHIMDVPRDHERPSSLAAQEPSATAEEPSHSSSRHQRRPSEDTRAIKLLNDIFPPGYLIGLYEGGGMPAKMHENGSLLFADMVGFTAWSAQQTPDQVFSALTLFYQLLDMYCQDCGGYKIETVGDCYVASFGIISSGKTGEGADPSSKSDGAINAIEMGLRIVEVNPHASSPPCEAMHM